MCAAFDHDAGDTPPADPDGFGQNGITGSDFSTRALPRIPYNTPDRLSESLSRSSCTHFRYTCNTGADIYQMRRESILCGRRRADPAPAAARCRAPWRATTPPPVTDVPSGERDRPCQPERPSVHWFSTVAFPPPASALSIGGRPPDGPVDRARRRGASGAYRPRVRNPPIRPRPFGVIRAVASIVSSCSAGKRRSTPNNCRSRYSNRTGKLLIILRPHPPLSERNRCAG